MLKQIRMFLFWFFLLSFDIVAIIAVIYLNVSFDEDEVYEEITNFKNCILINGDDEDCEFEGSPPYSLVFLLNFLGFLTPIVTFVTLISLIELRN